MSSSVFFQEDVSHSQIKQLKKAAIDTPLKRSRICLHKDTDDPIQEMVITLCENSYVAPHRNQGKDKSYHIIDGELLVVFFDETGQLINKVELGTCESGKTFLYRFDAALWHTVISLTESVCYKETVAGPFVKSEEELADWAPCFDDEIDGNLFMKTLKT